MDFEIRGNLFKIELVNNWCREKYQEMLDLISELYNMPDAVHELVKEATDDNRRETKEAIREYDKRQRVITKEITDIRKEIVRELLETNGYEYDEKFWSRKCDVEDVNSFMLDSLKKDASGKGSKKK